MKKRLLKNDILISLVIAISFFILSISLPIYDDLNGFHNILFDTYKLTWYDGKSPLNFYLIQNLIHNKPLSFPEGYKLGNMPVENYFDFFKIKNVYKPMFGILYLYIFSILRFIPLQTDLNLFKILISLNIVFSGITLILFYFIQRMLGLDQKYSAISTFVTGIATSILIYSRYLFLRETLYTLVFIALIYVILKNWKKTSIKLDFLISFIFFIFFIFTSNFIIISSFFIFFLYFYWKQKTLKSIIIFTVLIIVVITLLHLEYLYHYGVNKQNTINTNTLYKIFPEYINALDYAVFGYHNTSSVWKLYRSFSYVYGFEQAKGNALFLFTSGLFGSIFGPKGFLYNSPFLILSIFGILIYKQKDKRNFLVLITLLFIIIFGGLNFYWYGGVTPRYVRHFKIPILLLSFFSFYYIQKTKSNWTRLIFIILVILSILNVTSLAIRADWTYEHETDLVSYDLVLWPWYPPKPQENIINLYLTEQGESVGWTFGGEAECKAYGSLEGIITDVCDCEYATYAERNIKIPWEKFRVNVTACSRNGDGIIGKFYFGRVEKEIFIPPKSCEKESMLIENLEDEHSIILKSKRYGECIDETVVWKLITIEEI